MLADVLAAPQLSWQVVDEAELAVLVAPMESEDAAGTQADEFQLAAIESLPTRPAKKTDWSSFQPASREQAERQKRKSRSPIWGMLQVVLGGVAAVPISLVLIWHLLGTDVAGAGPFVGKYLPWIVPERFRPYQLPVTARDDSEAKAVRRGGFAPVENGELSGASESAERTGGSDAAAEARDTETVNESHAATVAPEPDVLDEDPLVENVFALIRQAKQHLTEWTEVAQQGNIDLKSLAQATYANLINVALVIQKIPTEQPVLRIIRGELKSIGRQVKASAEVRHLIDKGSEFWFLSQAMNPSDSENSGTRPDFGLAAIVSVASVDESSSTWTLSASDETTWFGQNKLKIQIPRDVAVHVEVGQKLFLLGVVEAENEKMAPDSQRFLASYAYEL